jgi:hypothetical protein
MVVWHYAWQHIRGRMDQMYEEGFIRQQQSANDKTVRDRQRMEQAANAAYQNLQGAMARADWTTARAWLNALKGQYRQCGAYTDHRDQVEAWDKQLQAYPLFRPSQSTVRPGRSTIRTR